MDEILAGIGTIVVTWGAMHLLGRFTEWLDCRRNPDMIEFYRRRRQDPKATWW
jgi:hypothetical protein